MDFTELEGRTFGPYRTRVCVEKVSEFVDVTGGDANRWKDSAPPGYLAAPLFVVAPELLSQLKDYSVIHGEQVFRWLAPIVMEADHWVTGTVSRVRERGGSYFVGFDMSLSNGNEEVANGSSLFLVTPVDATPDVTVAGQETAPREDGNPAAGQKSASRSDLVRYAAATRDWNPIHWDHNSARSAGLPGVVVHGLLQAAWALDAASSDVDGAQPIVTAKIRFRNPLLTARPVDVVVESLGNRKSVAVADGDTQFLTAQVELAEA